MTAPTKPPHRDAGPTPLQHPRPPSPATDGTPLHSPVIDWFDDHARDLPWRRPDAGPWGVMVSEFMLQQTPVIRVLPVYEQWLARWPRPADLAAAPSGEAVRAWGRLGYPRRALRLHGAAVAITERHGGDVPTEHAQLLALPGIGEYTAAAVASFAYGQRHAVLDTNVRRVLARAVTGVQYPRTPPPPPNASSPAPCCRTTSPRPPAGPRPRWSSARSSARPGTRAATAVRSPPSAPGGSPGSPSTRVRPAAVRRTRALIVRYAASCSPYSGKPTHPYRRRRSTTCGTSRSSAPGPSTASSPTDWSSPFRAGCTACRTAETDSRRSTQPPHMPGFP